jgi:hypothetical protein
MKPIQLINLTPHSIKLGNGETIDPTGYVSRVNTTQSQTGDIRGVPILESSLNKTVNIPEEEEGVAYIVPSVVRQMAPKRRDLLSPTKLIRDGRGNVVGCGALERNPVC